MRHSGNVDVIKVDNQALARPRHWDYIDYDDYHRPTLYNPLSQADDLPLLLQRRLPRGVRAAPVAGSCSMPPPLACSRSPRSATAMWRRAASRRGLDTAERLARPTAAGLHPAGAPGGVPERLGLYPRR